MNKNHNLIIFVFDYCVGRTSLTKGAEWGNRKIIDVNNNSDHWDDVANQYTAENFAEDIGESKDLDDEQWKQKIMDYCSKFNWDQEKFKVNSWSTARLLCTV